MQLLTNEVNYDSTIELAKNLKGDYNKPVIFHCFWSGVLSEKHLISIKSCYYFNIYNKNNNSKIILWLQNNCPNKYNKEIEKYVEIKFFLLENEKKNTFLENNNFKYNNSISHYSDVVRYLLLYKYGGCWFDLDCIFLRSFEPIFYNFNNEICVYQWETQNYPNGAIYISLEPKSEKMKSNIEFIINRNGGWGFQEANLSYDLPLHMLVLPCSWFDGDWIENSFNIGWDVFFKKTDKHYNFDNFFKDSFCYHWHNRWNVKIEYNSIIKQLSNIIDNNMQN
jgi:hypothetical protein